jgi:MazG family protein
LARKGGAGNRGRKKQGRAVGQTKSRRAQVAITKRDQLAGEWFAKLVALQVRLRGSNGCPWDREQTHESLRKFLIEEVYEVLDAMESGDARKFASELGDLLLQVIFHSILAEETGRFTISDVIESIYTKMIRRHPHVFGEVTAKTSAAVLKNWEQIKREERAEEKGRRVADDGFEDSVVAGVPRSLPAVLEAYQLTRRASHVGFDWENLAGILEKLEEEKREMESALLPSNSTREDLKKLAAEPGRSLQLEEEIGDLFFVCVNIARFLGFDPEIALKKANAKFKRRFQWMEAAAARQGHRFADLPRDEQEELWNRSKEAR